MPWACVLLRGRGVKYGLGTQILLTLAVIAGAIVERFLVGVAVRLAGGRGWQRSESARPRFWIQQGTQLLLLAPVHGVRAIKDAMGREILAGLQEAHLEIASGTYEIVGLPPVRVEQNTSGK